MLVFMSAERRNSNQVTCVVAIALVKRIHITKGQSKQQIMLSNLIEQPNKQFTKPQRFCGESCHNGHTDHQANAEGFDAGLYIYIPHFR